ncbi:MAG TPA: hypothetical protein PKZ97_05270 [Azospirillaceae bacterium]|nr:hypothetical protein [Azospirillaceae bacterium]HRQ80509.1 hypothetical protein [Azospirillaceae bacterium]
MRRLYFGSCAALILIGLSLAILAFFFAPEVYDEQGGLVAEMPPAFAVGLMLSFLGGVLAAAGLLLLVVKRLIRAARGQPD